MTWQEALATVSAARNNPRYAELCDGPQAEYWRARMIEMAGGPAVPRPGHGPVPIGQQPAAARRCCGGGGNDIMAMEPI